MNNYSLITKACQHITTYNSSFDLCFTNHLKSSTLGLELKNSLHDLPFMGHSFMNGSSIVQIKCEENLGAQKQT